MVAGCIRLDMNWAPKEDSNSSSFFSRNRASTSRWRPKDLTMAWPVKVSSTMALSAPVLRHWAMKRGRARAAIVRMAKTDTGTVVRATTASSGEMVNIMTATPMSSRIDVSIWLRVCCRLWAMLSMSLVTRLSRSPARLVVDVAQRERVDLVLDRRAQALHEPLHDAGEGVGAEQR